LSGGDEFVCERENLIVSTMLNFKPLKKFSSRVDTRRLWGSNDGTCENIVDVLKTVYLSIR